MERLEIIKNQINKKLYSINIEHDLISYENISENKTKLLYNSFLVNYIDTYNFSNRDIIDQSNKWNLFINKIMVNYKSCSKYIKELHNICVIPITSINDTLKKCIDSIKKQTQRPYILLVLSSNININLCYNMEIDYIVVESNILADKVNKALNHVQNRYKLNNIKGITLLEGNEIFNINWFNNYNSMSRIYEVVGINSDYIINKFEDKFYQRKINNNGFNEQNYINKYILWSCRFIKCSLLEKINWILMDHDQNELSFFHKLAQLNIDVGRITDNYFIRLLQGTQVTDKFNSNLEILFCEEMIPPEPCKALIKEYKIIIKLEDSVVIKNLINTKSTIINIGKNDKMNSGKEIKNMKQQEIKNIATEKNTKKNYLMMAQKNEAKLGTRVTSFCFEDIFEHIYVISVNNNTIDLCDVLEQNNITYEKVIGVSGDNAKIQTEFNLAETGNIPNVNELCHVLNYYKVINKARSKGYENILILYGDLRTPANFDHLCKNIIDVPNDWNILFMGSFLREGSNFNLNKTSFKKIVNDNGFFAYAVNKKYYSTLLNLFAKKDNYLYNIFKNLNDSGIFNVYPPLFTTNDAYYKYIKQINDKKVSKSIVPKKNIYTISQEEINKRRNKIMEDHWINNLPKLPAKKSTLAHQKELDDKLYVIINKKDVPKKENIYRDKVFVHKNNKKHLYRLVKKNNDTKNIEKSNEIIVKTTTPLLEKNKELVSIILPTLNGYPLIKRCINSIINQTHKNWELIIINDGSTNDDSIKYLDVIVQSNIHVYHSPKNEGLPHALNRGLTKCKGEYITWISDDNVFDEKCIESMIINLKEGNSFCYTSYSFTNELMKPIRSTYLNLEKYNYKNVIEKWKGMPSYLWSRETMKKIGYFDVDLHGGEDFDYVIRTFVVAKNIGYIDNVLFHYFRRDNTITTNLGAKILKLKEKITKSFYYIELFRKIFNALQYNYFNIVIVLPDFKENNIEVITSFFKDIDNKIIIVVDKYSKTHTETEKYLVINKNIFDRYIDKFYFTFDKCNIMCNNNYYEEIWKNKISKTLQTLDTHIFFDDDIQIKYNMQTFQFQIFDDVIKIMYDDIIFDNYYDMISYADNKKIETNSTKYVFKIWVIGNNAPIKKLFSKSQIVDQYEENIDFIIVNNSKFDNSSYKKYKIYNYQKDRCRELLMTVLNENLRILHYGSYWQGDNDIIKLMLDDLNCICPVKQIDTQIYNTQNNTVYYNYEPIPSKYPNKYVRYIKNDVILKHIKKFNPQIIITNSGGLTFTDHIFKYINQKGIITLGISLSDPDVFPYNGYIYANKYDYYYTNSVYSLENEYKFNNIKLLPFACSTQLHKPLDIKKKYDVVIVGGARPERISIINKLKRHFNVGIYGGGWPKKYNAKKVNGHEHVKALNSGHIYISFALTVAGYMNVKVGIFEAAACRMVLITEEFDEIQEYFKKDEEILLYRNPDQLVGIIKTLLENPNRMEKLKEGSYQRFLQEHTWKNRWQNILSDLC